MLMSDRSNFVSQDQHEAHLKELTALKQKAKEERAQLAAQLADTEKQLASAGKQVEAFALGVHQSFQMTAALPWACFKDNSMALLTIKKPGLNDNGRMLLY